MKIHKLALIIIIIISGCFSIKQGYQFSLQILKIKTFYQICGDIKKINDNNEIQNDSIIRVTSNDINIIYLNKNRIIQYKKDSLSFNPQDLNPFNIHISLNSEFLDNWEDSISFEKTLALVKIKTKEHFQITNDSNKIIKNCYVGIYNFDGEKLNIIDSLKFCEDWPLLSDSSIWSKPVNNISEIKTRMKGKQFGNF
ncbi:MAG: hypothetical protein QNK68_01440 [Flavobacteriales bacterium]